MDRMRYKQFESLGHPIGSGAIESAVRRVINLRMKGYGIFWIEDTAEGMIHLRSYLKAGRWDQLVARTIQPPFYTIMVESVQTAVQLFALSFGQGQHVLLGGDAVPQLFHQLNSHFQWKFSQIECHVHLLPVSAFLCQHIKSESGIMTDSQLAPDASPEPET